MAEKSSTTRNISDLVAVVLLCGVVAAMVASGPRIGNLWNYMFAFAIVMTVWISVRARRGQLVCEECGKRFVLSKGANIVTDCPKCGRPTTVRPRTVIQQAIAVADVIIWSMALVIFTIAGLAFNFATSLSIAAPIVALGGLMMSWSRRARPANVERTCQSCGDVDSLEPPAPRLCPGCRTRKLTPDQAGKAQARAIRIIVAGTGIVGLFVLYLIAVNVQSMRDLGDWDGLPWTLFLAFVLLYGSWALVRFLRRAHKMTALLNENVLLDKARDITGEAGTLVRDGATLIWYSGPANPVPMLEEENALAHRRFETFFGEPIVDQPSFRALCFHDLNALVQFFLTSFPGKDLTGHRGLLVRRPWNVVTLCTGEAPGRLDPPARIAAVLFDMLHVEHVYGVKLGPWIQFGLPKALTACERPVDLGRLNRRMVMSLSTGTAWLDELFSAPTNRLAKLASGRKDFHPIQKLEQFIEQSWSVVEFLGGLDVGEERRAGFLAFLKDKRSRSHPEESLMRHLGYGYGTLLDAWRDWVLEQGIGPNQAPPPEARDRLVNRVLPMIRDRIAAHQDRIQAIRDWRKAGYVLGADTVIDLLRDPGDIPSEEIVWSLRVVSGMAYGADPDQWQAWWDGPPPARVESSVVAVEVRSNAGSHDG